MKNSANKSILANCALLFTAMLWGGGFVAGKMSLTGAAPMAVLAWRFTTAAILCLIIFRRRILAAGKDTAVKACGIGLLQIASLSLQLTGLQYTTSAKQSFLCTAYVALVPFLSWAILGKRPKTTAFAAGILALAGIGFISLNGAGGINIGDVLSLCFSVGFGIQIVLVGKFVSADTDGIALTFYQLLAGGLAAAAVCMVTGTPLAVRGTEAMAGIAYLIIGNTFLAFTLQNVAQKYTKDSLAALLLSFESVFGFIFSVLYYHEVLSVRLIAGCAMCFAAVLLSVL